MIKLTAFRLFILVRMVGQNKNIINHSQHLLSMGGNISSQTNSMIQIFDLFVAQHLNINLKVNLQPLEALPLGHQNY